jgi:hypothetical protein
MEVLRTGKFDIVNRGAEDELDLRGGDTFIWSNILPGQVQR